MFLPLFAILLLLPMPPIFGQSRLFEWRPSNRLSLGANWLGEGAKGPCAEDIARLGTEEAADGGIELATLEGSLGVSKLELQENGILYFGESAELGERPADWQCPKRESGPQDALFRPPKIAVAPNYFDAANWEIKRKGGEGPDQGGEGGLVLLDAEKLPSSVDSVVFPLERASKVFIDAPARMGQLNFSGRSMSNDQLRRLLFTIEGQFLLRIGSRLGMEVHVDGRYQFQWPAEPVFSLEPEMSGKEAQKAAFFGLPNSNFFEPQFSAICQFVRCESVESYCSEPVKAFGQCCEECGAVLQFRQNSLNFSQSQAILRLFSKMASDWGWLLAQTGLSLVRIDKADFHPLYQLAVLGPHPSLFSESMYCSLMWAAFKKVQQGGVNAHLPVDYRPSKEDGQNYFGLEAKCSVQKGLIRSSTVLRWLLLCLAFGAILAFAFRAEYRRSPRFRLFLANLGTAASGTAVRWQSATGRVHIGQESEESRWLAGGVLEFVNRAFLRPGPEENEQDKETDRRAEEKPTNWEGEAVDGGPVGEKKEESNLVEF